MNVPRWRGDLSESHGNLLRVGDVFKNMVGHNQIEAAGVLLLSAELNDVYWKEARARGQLRRALEQIDRNQLLRGRETRPPMPSARTASGIQDEVRRGQ